MGDTKQEALRRCTVVPGLHNHTIEDVQQMLHNTNKYVSIFKSALDKMDMQNHKVVIRPDAVPRHEHPGRHNAPSEDEVAVVIAEGHKGSKRDIILENKNSFLQRVCESNKTYDPLQYPLMFPYGEDGYHWEMKETNRTTGQPT
ncbi:hypothetical protein ACOMHN_065112 [Nucella lapillus]